MVEHSVLVYARNDGRFIAPCLNSLLEQTQVPDEIIVYDAASDDETSSILKSYAGRIRVVQGDPRDADLHRQEAHAFQSAFGFSSGRIVFLLEARDRFKAEKVERYAAAFEEYPDACIVQAPAEDIDEAGGYLGSTFNPDYHVVNHLREIYRRHDVNFFYPTSTLAFSRFYLERVIPFDFPDELPLWVDARLGIPAAYFGRIVTLPDPYTERLLSPSTNREDRLAPLRQTLLRARVFNRFCRQHGLRTISPWRNLRLYLQVLRYLTPRPLRRFVPAREHTTVARTR